ncbi:hypothetical protein SUGI_0331410 [Cryptomeria japonica]|nr:hypothetical protein SUGI_0331410 [Cryptomeria japonica]
MGEGKKMKGNMRLKMKQLSTKLSLFCSIDQGDEEECSAVTGYGQSYTTGGLAVPRGMWIVPVVNYSFLLSFPICHLFIGSFKCSNFGSLNCKLSTFVTLWGTPFFMRGL